MKSVLSSSSSAILLSCIILVAGQQNCYYGHGAGFLGPSELVSCNTTSGFSACCLLGDTCLSGSTCYNPATNNLYQYGCTDISYQDGSCPRKCGWDPILSPWVGLEYCTDIQDLDDTWTCLSPETCGCDGRAHTRCRFSPRALAVLWAAKHALLCTLRPPSCRTYLYLDTWWKYPVLLDNDRLPS